MTEEEEQEAIRWIESQEKTPYSADWDNIPSRGTGNLIWVFIVHVCSWLLLAPFLILLVVYLPDLLHALAAD